MDNFVKWSNEIRKNYAISNSVPQISKEGVALFFKVKSFLPVWEELEKRARPLSERKLILQNLRYDVYKKKMQEGSYGKGKSNEVYARLCELRMKTACEARELNALVQEEEKLTREQKNLELRLHSLRSSVESYEGKTSHANQLRTSLDDLLPRYSTYSSAEEESIEQKHAIECADEILEILRQLKIHQLNSSDKEDDVKKMKIEVIRLIYGLKAKYSPSIIYRAILHYVKKDMESLRSMREDTSEPNKNKKMKDEKLTKTLAGKDHKDPIKSQLLLMNCSFIKKHSFNNKMRRDAQLTEEALSNVLENIKEAIQGLNRGPEFENTLQQFLDAKLKVAGLQASISTCKILQKDFSERATVCLRLKEKLTDLYSQINTRQTQCRNSYRDVKSMLEWISRNSEMLKQPEMLTIVKSLPANENCSHFLDNFKTSSLKELEIFMDLPYVPLHHNIQGRLCYLPENDLFNKINICNYDITPNFLIDLVRQWKIRNDMNEKNLEEETNLLLKIKNNPCMETFSFKQIEELSRRVHQFDAQQESQMIPVLEKCETRIRETENKLQKFKDLVNEWWNQPGNEIKSLME